MSDTPVCRLTDLARLRSAPELESSVIVALHRELTTAMAMFSWFTVGVMASSASEALEALRSLERDQNWDALDVVQSPSEAGPVYLKANQQGGTIRIRGAFAYGIPKSPRPWRIPQNTARTRGEHSENTGRTHIQRWTSENTARTQREYSENTH